MQIYNYGYTLKYQKDVQIFIPMLFLAITVYIDARWIGTFIYISRGIPITRVPSA